MGHDYVVFRNRSALFRDPHLNLVRCIMRHVAKTSGSQATFSIQLQKHLEEFYWLTTGVFTDFHMDDLLSTTTNTVRFLDFLDECAAFVCENGPLLDRKFLNDIVNGRDDWKCDLPYEYPLAGLGRLANLVTASQPENLNDYADVWNEKEISIRMQQQRMSGGPRPT